MSKTSTQPQIVSKALLCQIIKSIGYLYNIANIVVSVMFEVTQENVVLLQT